MIGKTGILAAAALSGAAAAAQGTGQEAPPVPAAVKPQPTAGTGAPSGSATGAKIWFQIGVSPEITSEANLPRNTDSTKVGWLLGVDYVFARGWTAKLSLGPSATVDSDRDSRESSSFDVGLALESSNPLVLGLTPTISYQYTRKYQSFFADRDGHQHTFEGTLNRQFKWRWATLDVPFGPQRIDASNAADDYWAVRLRPKLTVPLLGDSVRLVLNLNLERRWYDETDPTIGRPRRDFRVETVAGLNFAPVINRWLASQGNRQDIVREFTIGGRWIENNSNVDGQDKSSLRFTPSMTVRIPLN